MSEHSSESGSTETGVQHSSVVGVSLSFFGFQDSKKATITLLNSEGKEIGHPTDLGNLGPFLTVMLLFRHEHNWNVFWPLFLDQLAGRWRKEGGQAKTSQDVKSWIENLNKGLAQSGEVSLKSSFVVEKINAESNGRSRVMAEIVARSKEHRGSEVLCVRGGEKPGDYRPLFLGVGEKTKKTKVVGERPSFIEGGWWDQLRSRKAFWWLEKPENYKCDLLDHLMKVDELIQGKDDAGKLNAQDRLKLLEQQRQTTSGEFLWPGSDSSSYSAFQRKFIEGAGKKLEDLNKLFQAHPCEEDLVAGGQEDGGNDQDSNPPEASGQGASPVPPHTPEGGNPPSAPTSSPGAPGELPLHQQAGAAGDSPNGDPQVPAPKVAGGGTAPPLGTNAKYPNEQETGQRSHGGAGKRYPVSLRGVAVVALLLAAVTGSFWCGSELDRGVPARDVTSGETQTSDSNRSATPPAEQALIMKALLFQRYWLGAWGVGPFNGDTESGQCSKYQRAMWRLDLLGRNWAYKVDIQDTLKHGDLTYVALDGVGFSFCRVEKGPSSDKPGVVTEKVIIEVEEHILNGLARRSPKTSDAERGDEQDEHWEIFLALETSYWSEFTIEGESIIRKGRQRGRLEPQFNDKDKDSAIWSKLLQDKSEPPLLFASVECESQVVFELRGEIEDVVLDSACTPKGEEGKENRRSYRKILRRVCTQAQTSGGGDECEPVAFSAKDALGKKITIPVEE